MSFNSKSDLLLCGSPSLKLQLFKGQSSRLVSFFLGYNKMKFLLAIAEIYKSKGCQKGLLPCEIFMGTLFAYHGENTFINISGFKTGKKCISGKCSLEGSFPLLKYLVPRRHS